MDMHVRQLSLRCSNSEQKAEWDAKCEEWRLGFSDKGSLSTLKGLHEKFPENRRITTAYASGLSFYSKHEESALLYEAATNSASAANEVLSNKIEAALERAKAGQPDLAQKLLNDAKSIANQDADLSYSLA